MDLHAACFLGDISRVESALYVEDVNGLCSTPQSDERESALSMAVKGGQFDVCDLLLKVS